VTGLTALQQRMHAALVVPDADPQAATALFAGDGRLGAADGLAIYQRGYLLRITACMREQFPALCHALGRPLFDDFVADYIRDCPPERHSLYDLGRRFAGWMEASRPDGTAREGWIDFMIDLARFEYAVFTLFDAEGDEGTAFADQDTLDAELRLQRGFSLGSYGFPVASYYHAVRCEETPAVPPPMASHVALVRTDYVTRTVPLTETQHAFLQRLHDGESVDAALAGVAARFGLDPERTRESWRARDGIRARWIDWGLFVRRG
jgi:hypothetical protein